MLLASFMTDATPLDPPAIKDEKEVHPIACEWRAMLREVVMRFARRDYDLEGGIVGVEPVSPETAQHIRGSVEDYGATLIELPEEAWQTSISQWSGTHWNILLDLWTAEEGPSDLVLGGRITESEFGPRLSIHMVYVP
ncbi:DUF7668 domain-containing protein [Inhella inkyongensis]